MSNSFEHEKALRAHGITAEVIHDGTDRVLVALSVDALDDLIDRYTGPDALVEASSEGYDIGSEEGYDEGYQAACDDIREMSQ